jgi:hypothetical protein
MFQQVGGRLLGKGSYACTFSPVPSCESGSTTGGSVAKVSVQDMTAEVAMGRTLMALHGGRDYFALPTSSCLPRLPITDPDASKCHVLKKNKPLTMAAMPDAGVSLTSWSRTGLTPASLQAMLVHVLRGMVLYQRAGFVHNDIHGGNIMVGEDGLARYIDFGQGFRPSALRTWDDLNLGRRFAAEYVWLAPELHAIRIRSQEDHAAIHRLYMKIPEFKQLEVAYPERQGFKAAMEEFRLPIDPVAYMRQHGFKIDWWRLGITVWQLWRRLRKGHEGSPLDKAIGGLTEFDSARRMSPATALRILGRTGSHSRRRTRRVKARRS